MLLFLDHLGCWKEEQANTIICQCLLFNCAESVGREKLLQKEVFAIWYIIIACQELSLGWNFQAVWLSSSKLLPDLLKVNYFARTEFCPIKCCAELCTKIAIKHKRFDKTFSNRTKNMKKCLFCKSGVPKLKFCAYYRKFCADMRPSVRAF